jgi:hypothetical protein
MPSIHAHECLHFRHLLALGNQAAANDWTRVHLPRRHHPTTDGIAVTTWPCERIMHVSATRFCIVQVIQMMYNNMWWQVGKMFGEQLT